jgi:hypothetical protein
MLTIVTKEGLHPAAAGAVAATVWSVLEPLDERLFRSDYSDVAVLGKAVTRGPGWLPAGLAIHALNGALFGFAYDQVRRRLPYDSRRVAVGMALVEHLALFPLGALVDRYHPARGEPGLPSVTTARAFGQATLRHAVFGFVLGRLSREP